MTAEPLRYRLLDAALERRLLPDPVLRAGTRAGAVLRLRLRREQRALLHRRHDALHDLLHYLLEPRGGNGTKPLVRSTYSG